MLQTLQGLQDPRNKPDNPNPDIFTRLLQGWPKTPPEPAIFSSADEHYIREALGSNPTNIVVGFERNYSVEGVRKILYFGDRKR